MPLNGFIYQHRPGVEEQLDTEVEISVKVIAAVSLAVQTQLSLVHMV